MKENSKCHIRENSNEGRFIHSRTGVMGIRETFLKGNHCKKVLVEWVESDDFGHLET